MKKLIFGIAAAATLAVSMPAAAQGIVIGENRHGNVVVRPAGVYHGREYYGRHYNGGYHRHRVEWFDRRGHRHVEWR
jgi:hypothetical protein